VSIPAWLGLLSFLSTSVPALAQTSALVSQPSQIWFGMGRTDTPKGRADWNRIFFEPDATWPEMLRHVQVITATADALTRLTDDELAKFVQRLDEHHIALSVAVLAQNWENQPKCGNGVEGYSNPGTNRPIIARLKRVGGRISYIGMDEPLYFGHYYAGKNACQSSIDNVAERVATILREYTAAFPDLTVLDTEPFPGISDQHSWQEDYGRWMAAFRAHVGRPLGGLNIDVNWPQPWSEGLRAAFTFARSQRLTVGIVYWASPKPPVGGHVTNDMWLDSAADNFYMIEKREKLIPDRAMFASWSQFPERAIGDASGLGEDDLIRRYLKMKGQH